MISGEGVPAKIKEYAATSMNLTTREEILSAMVVYGFLSYHKVLNLSSSCQDYCLSEKPLLILDKKYSLRFSGKAGEKAKYTGEILAVGIGYNKKTKKHQCRVITLRKGTLY